MPAARRVSVKEAFENNGLELPATHLKNQTRSRGGGPSIRSVQEQAFTVCASHALTWCDREGKTIKVMSSADSAVLMGFPRSWRLPHGSRVSQRAVGNALCVEMSKSIMEAAIQVHVQPSPLPSQDARPKRATPSDDSLPNSTDDLHRILKRLKRIERALVSPVGEEVDSVEGAPYGDA